MSYVIKNCIERQPRQGNIPMGRIDEGIYKHSTDEDWDNDISRPGTWDWDGPHSVYAIHTPVTQVGRIIVLQGLLFEK